MKNVINHFKTICDHKKWVFYYCCKTGIPWRGIKHDISKFSPTEFFESIKFYSGNDSPINACKKANGYSKSWQHHKGRNTHHYEYWTDNYDNGTTYIEMPFEDAVELICDHFGASRVYLKDKFSFSKEYSWWEIKREKCAMNENTKRFVNLVYEAIDRKNGNISKILNKYTLWSIYQLSNIFKDFSDDKILDIALDDGPLFNCHTDELKHPIRMTWFLLVWFLTHPYKNYICTKYKIDKLRKDLVKKFGINLI